MSELTPDAVAEIVRTQLATVWNPRVAARIRELLVRPYCVHREWDYGAPGTTYPCWTVLEDTQSKTGIAYCEQGFGPSDPWGLVFLSGENTSIGMDCGWYSTLEGAFRESRACDDVESRGVRVVECERTLITSTAGSPGAFPDAVDGLLSVLLSGGSGYSGRSTDGVFFEFKNVTGQGASGVGMVVLIEGQLVEPLRVRFSFNSSKSEIDEGLVCLGDRSRPAVQYGSAAHDKLRRRILADPQVEFPWRVCFYRDRTTGTWEWQAT